MGLRDHVHQLVHFLYEPAMLGRGAMAVPKWREPLHRIHLIPGSWLEKACDRYDRYLETEKETS